MKSAAHRSFGLTPPLTRRSRGKRNVAKKSLIGFTGTNSKKSLGGFTVVEVIIVLAVSAVLLSASLIVFAGRRQTTEFSQAMYDLQSKFQSYANQVSSQAVPSGYTCDKTTSPSPEDGKYHPFLTSSPGNTQPTKQVCISLGLAIQVINDGDTIYAYPVFGFRNAYDGSMDTGVLAATVQQANPEIARDSAGNPLLVTNYPILNGLTVKNATVEGESVDKDLLTFYSSPQNNNTSGNQITATARQITFAKEGGQDLSNLIPCVQEYSAYNGGACLLPSFTTDLAQAAWKLCLTNGQRDALLSVHSTATGINTKLNMNGCP